ncbi:MAG TPA: M28 family metallopeptidase [Steroidobacteraceae bacterium]|nr:M28 family metallopeptidase [Steroidobacteraceae bacterium]
MPNAQPLSRVLLLSLIASGLCACQSGDDSSAPAAARVIPAPAAIATSATPPPMAVALAPQINDSDFLQFDRTLSSDAFDGRKPATRGEVLTIRYLVDQFRHMRVTPGNHGYWLQSVPVVTTTLVNTGVKLEARTGSGLQAFAYGTDMMAFAQDARPLVALRGAPIVFMGYGIDAPRWQWNDYQGVSVKGKTVIVLVNDPGYATGDPQLFDGKAMTWYGSGVYKYEEAARMGAAACFIVHTSDDAAGYPWAAVRNSNSGPLQSLPASVAPGPRLPVAGWLTLAAAERLFHAAGLDFDSLATQAGQRGFTPVPLKATASIVLRSAVVHERSYNLLALVKGSRHPDQVVIYSAHWDHLGTAPAARGRREIFHGAIDNGSGLAALLEIADAFAHQKTPPERSILFLMPTLEEAALLGSQYYVSHPVYPLDRTVADINIDAWPVIGRARDMTVIGAGQSQLEDDLKRVLSLQGRELTPEATPQSGFYFRSDHFSFAQAGVPALIAAPGLDLIEGGRTAGIAASADYTARRYHTPYDVFDPNWDLSGTLEDIQTLYLLGRNLADGDEWPDWYDGSGFRARRDAMMAKARQPAAAGKPVPPAGKSPPTSARSRPAP